ncbi:MAG: VOC family protein [Planctomycetota bacterium]|nr:VOC family protein [Planctomycetota bacterium]
MKIEHIAYNVEDPLAMGRWYVEHLGLKVKRRTVDAPYAHFLADDSGTVMIEIYGNKSAPLPDYRSMNPAELHLAFVSKDVESDVRRLTVAGATQVGEIDTASNGDQLAMLRDPWGFAIQLVKRATPMI